MNAALDTAAASRATFHPGAEKYHGFGDPITEGAAAAPFFWTAACFMPTCCVWRTATFTAGRVGTPARVCRSLCPVVQPNTVCHLCLDAKVAGFKPVAMEPFMANTAPMGRIAPASKPSTGNTPHFDPVALHGEAINACAMATYYTRKGNHAGAARKAVQAWAALRVLHSMERGAA